jgi:hypothetical protein
LENKARDYILELNKLSYTDDKLSSGRDFANYLSTQKSKNNPERERKRTTEKRDRTSANIDRVVLKTVKFQ